MSWSFLLSSGSPVAELYIRSERKKSYIKIADKPKYLVSGVKTSLIGYLNIYIPIITGSSYMKNVGELQDFFLDPAC